MQKIVQLYFYIIYKIKSRNEHSVHSPFVYSLLMDVIYNKSEFYSYSKIEELRASHLESGHEVACEDLGAGSSRSISSRTIKSIATLSLKPAKYGQLLFRVVNYFQPQNIIELGTSLGVTTCYLAKANTKARVITLEGCSQIAEIAKLNFITNSVANVELITGNFDDVLPKALSTMDTADFVFFDGNHRKVPTLNYFELCMAKANENSVFVFDDIYWSVEMKQTWEEIKKDQRVRVTIDLFYVGIVFFRKEQVKQDFVIRF